MSTEKQLVANRKNALKSTGPRTPEGKAASRLNALRHGLLSRDILLLNEDRDQLEGLRTRLVACLQPEGELEELLVDRIVSAVWRLRRAGIVEAGLFQHEMDSQLNEFMGDKWKANLGLIFIRGANSADVFSKLSRYEGHLERGLYKALHELQRLQTARAGDYFLPPAALDVTLDGGFVSQNEGNGNRGNVSPEGTET